MKYNKLSFINLDINALTELVLKAPGSLVTMHAEMAYYYKKNIAYSKAIRSAKYIVADGVGLNWGLKFLGINARKVSGIDLVNHLIESKSARIFFWGASEDVIRAAVERSKDRGASIVGHSNGYRYLKDEVLKDIEKSGANVVLIGMGGSPRQIELANEVYDKLGISAITVGGTFDVLAGKFKRAPKIFQVIGLEWFWRIIIDPKRFHKIFPLIGFVWEVLIEKFQR